MQFDDLKNAWTVMFPNVPVPTDAQWTVWQLAYTDKTIRQALAALGSKYIRTGGDMSADYMVKFASAVMNRLGNAERDAAVTA